MNKIYSLRGFTAACALVFVAVFTSCKKDNNSFNSSPVTPAVATPTKLGLYEIDSSIYKLLLIDVTKVGTQSVENDLIFDTGSGGMVLDADGLIPKTMYTDAGFNFTGDSLVYNGITITNKTSTISYGADNETTDNVYGNLAYADVTIGDQGSNIVVKRLPFFIYYKATDSKGKSLDPHEFDILGVSPQYDITFSGNLSITSPFSYYDPGTGLTKGMKLSQLNINNFSTRGPYVADAVTLGLKPSDLSSSSGFVMHDLTYSSRSGYSPVVSGTITYNNKTFSSPVVFDTGTEPFNYIEDKTGPKVATLMPNNTSFNVTTGAGFAYPFTTSATHNLTYVENPTYSGSTVSILSLDFFFDNEYMLDYTNHRLGVKNM